MEYATGRVYIIICNLNPKIFYIGSTFNLLKQRFNKHKSHYKEGTRCSISKYFEKYGVENFTMKLLKEYKVIRETQKDNKHLCVYETLWINKIKGNVNKVLPFNPLRENIELNKILRKEWKQDNKDKIKEQNKEYYKKNISKIVEYRKDRKDKQKEYDKKRYENNKEQIRIKANAKKECPYCKKMMNGSNLARHIKSNHKD
jgi:hypothetical protein